LPTKKQKNPSSKKKHCSTAHSLEIYLVDKEGAKERGASGRRDKHLSAGKSKRNRWIKKGNPKTKRKMRIQTHPDAVNAVEPLDEKPRTGEHFQYSLDRAC
jgi:hypothetical protein